MASRDQSQSSERARASAASEGADAASAAEPQPDEFPVDFDEWVGQQPAVWRTAMAGFRHEVRANDELRTPRLRGEWQQAFDAFLGAETAK